MVTPIAGNQADIGIALQAAAGTPAAAAQHRFYLTGGGFGSVKAHAMVEETADKRLLSDSYVTTIKGEGSPQAVVRPDFIGLLLYGAMGAKAVAGAGDPYTHTFTLASVLPYLTAWRRLGPVAAGGLYERFTDCKVGSLVFSSQAAGLLQVTAGLVGVQPAYKDAAEVGVTAETGSVFLHADGHGALKVETTAVSTIESAEISIDNGGGLLQGDDVVGYGIFEGRQTIRVTTTELVEDFALWNRMMYGTATPSDDDVPVRTILELGGSPAGLDFKYTLPGSGAERSLKFTATKVQVGIDGIDPNVNGDPLKRRVTYEILQPASGSGLTSVLKNGHASYSAA